MYDFKKYHFGTEYWDQMYKAIEADTSPSARLVLAQLSAQVTRLIEVMESRIPARQHPHTRPDGTVIRERDRATFEVSVNGKAEIVAGWDELLARFPRFTETALRQRFSKGGGSISCLGYVKAPNSNVPVPAHITITRLDIWKRRGPGRPRKGEA